MRIVIKIGTSSLTHATGKLNLRRVDELARVVSDLKNAGHEILLVSSGAIAMGVSKLKLPSRPADVPTKQAAAAVGQCELMYIYDRMFLQYGQTVAQILLTLDTVDYPDRKINTENTLFRLLEMGVIPIINENDTVSTEEFSVGDNDTLGAKIACLAGAELLVILSDIDGLYSSDPRVDGNAKLISSVHEITDEIRSLAGGAGTPLGTGGMETKIRAAETVTSHGCDLVIANGGNPSVLYDITAGKPAGTRFFAKRNG